MRCPRSAEGDAVQRLLGLGVEAGRGVRGAGGRRRPLLELRVVARRDGEPGLARKSCEQRLCERRPLDRIGAGGDLVEQDERAVSCALEDRNEVPDVAGERREAHGDRLLVADIGEDGVEDGERDLVGGRSEPALVQQGGQAERLQRDGLAAGVRARDHERPEIAEREVDRHRHGRVEQRVARSVEDDLVTYRHERAPPGARERPAGNGEVDPSDGLDERDEPLGARAHGGRELAQDSCHLVALGALRFAKPVRVLDDGERLHEERLARAGAVVDDAGDAPARRRPEREHGPPRARGDEVVLQVLAQIAGLARGAGAAPSAAHVPRAARRRRRRSAGEAPSRRSEPSSSTARSIASASDRSPGSISIATAARPGASANASSASRAATPCSTVDAIARSAAVSSVLPRSASAAAGRTSRTRPSSGSAEWSRSVTASDVRRCRTATSSGSPDGARASASACPGSLEATAARRSRIAGSSSSSRARASIPAV